MTNNCPITVWGPERRRYSLPWLFVSPVCHILPSFTTIMPDYDNDAHSVEFEAPLSSDNIALAKKHFSIDLSLELERQLDMESFSSIPAYYQNIDVGRDGNKPAHDVLDPQVLAHIVKQLQQALTEITRDRDELREQIAVSHSHEAELQDALQHMIDKATAMDVELTAARKKMKDDEEAITLLRAKVEESRYVNTSPLSFYCC